LEVVHIGVIDAADFNALGEQVTIMVSDDDATEARGKVLALTAYKGEYESAGQQ
jgi:hypothetical protein